MGIEYNLKKLREDHGLTQEQLGEIAGVSDKAVSTWETGSSFPRMGAIQRMADYFGISKSMLIEDSPGNESFPSKEEKPIPENELDKELVSLLADLTPQEAGRVADFVSGLKAARAEGASLHKKGQK